MDKETQKNPALEIKLGAAIQLVKLGKSLEARKLIKEIMAAFPLYEPAWLWFADTFSDEEERLQVLQIYGKKFPESQQAARVSKFVQKRLSELAASVPEEIYYEESPQENLQQVSEQEPEQDFGEAPEPELPVFEEPDVQEDWLPQEIVEDFSRASRVVGEVLEVELEESEEEPQDSEQSAGIEEKTQQPESDQSEEDIFSVRPFDDADLLTEENLLEILAEETKPEEIWERFSEKTESGVKISPAAEDWGSSLQEEQTVDKIEEDLSDANLLRDFLGEEVVIESEEKTSPFLNIEEDSEETGEEEKLIWTNPFIKEEVVNEEPIEESKPFIPDEVSDEEKIVFDFDPGIESEEELSEIEAAVVDIPPEIIQSKEKTRPRKQILADILNENPPALEAESEDLPKIFAETESDSTSENGPLLGLEDNFGEEPETEFDFIFEAAEEIFSGEIRPEVEQETEMPLESGLKPQTEFEEDKTEMSSEELAGVSGLDAESFMELEKTPEDFQTTEAAKPIQRTDFFVEELNPESPLPWPEEDSAEETETLETRVEQKQKIKDTDFQFAWSEAETGENPEREDLVSEQSVEEQEPQKYQNNRELQSEIPSETGEKPADEHPAGEDILSTREPVSTEETEEEERQTRVVEFERFLEKIQNEKTEEGSGLFDSEEENFEIDLGSAHDEGSFLNRSDSDFGSNSHDFPNNIFSEEYPESEDSSDFAESETLQALSKMLHEKNSYEKENLAEEKGNFFDDLAGNTEGSEQAAGEDYFSDEFQQEVDEAFESIGEIGLDDLDDDFTAHEERDERWNEAEEELLGKKSSSADRTILVVSIIVILFTVILAVIWTVTRW